MKPPVYQDATIPSFCFAWSRRPNHEGGATMKSYLPWLVGGLVLVMLPPWALSQPLAPPKRGRGVLVVAAWEGQKKMLETAVAAFNKNPSKDFKRHALNLNNLGLLYQELGDY